MRDAVPYRLLKKQLICRLACSSVVARSLGPLRASYTAIRLIGMRLKRVYDVLVSTGELRRFMVYRSFVTAKPEPNDVDVFLVMQDSFNLGQVAGEARLVFDHSVAEADFGASVFWLRRLAALPSEEEACLGWQVKRDGTQRGIVEVMEA